MIEKINSLERWARALETVFYLLFIPAGIALMATLLDVGGAWRTFAVITTLLVLVIMAVGMTRSVIVFRLDGLRRERKMTWQKTLSPHEIVKLLSVKHSLSLCESTVLELMLSKRTEKLVWGWEELVDVVRAACPEHKSLELELDVLLRLCLRHHLLDMHKAVDRLVLSDTFWEYVRWLEPPEEFIRGVDDLAKVPA